MIYQKEVFVDKNGKCYILRSPDAADAEQMIAYLKTTAEETAYGLSYPEEMDFSVEDEERFIADAASDADSIMIAVFDEDTLVGYADLSGVSDRKKTRHRATFGVALLRSHGGRAWAKSCCRSW